MIEFLAGQSLLTTIDAPAVSHVSRASARKPLPGALLLPDVRSIMQAAADLDLPSLGVRIHRDRFRSKSLTPL